MPRTELCLLPSVVACLAVALVGCLDERRSGAPNAVALYGRVSGSYEVCLHLGDDLTTLTPSLVCDRDGAIPYSFNIEVQAGSDPEGAPCSFELAYDQPIEVAEDGTFQVPPPGEDSEFLVLGTIEGGAADGLARRIGTSNGDCELLWAASAGPVCREDDEAICMQLLDCCESIFLVPPFLQQCLGVVDECNGSNCREVLSGYTQCPQPPDAGVPDASSGAAQ